MIENFVHYLKQTEKISTSRIKTIFDIGARDCQQSLELSNAFSEAQIFAFEANPRTLPLCRNLARANPKIQLIEGAVNVFDGEVDFYPVDQERTQTTWRDGNPGASSLFVSNGEYTLEHYVQDKVRVSCHRLDSICRKYSISKIDLVWMDLQGAELLALQSLGKSLETIDYIFTEVSFRAIYHGQCMFQDVHAYLTNSGFDLQTEPDRGKWQDDVIYRNRKAGARNELKSALS